MSKNRMAYSDNEMLAMLGESAPAVEVDVELEAGLAYLRELGGKTDRNGDGKGSGNFRNGSLSDVEIGDIEKIADSSFVSIYKDEKEVGSVEYFVKNNSMVLRNIVIYKLANRRKGFMGSALKKILAREKYSGIDDDGKGFTGDGKAFYASLSTFELGGLKDADGDGIQLSEMKYAELHLGGVDGHQPHPDGSPQSVHGGGSESPEDDYKSEDNFDLIGLIKFEFDSEITHQDAVDFIKSRLQMLPRSILGMSRVSTVELFDDTEYAARAIYDRYGEDGAHGAFDRDTGHMIAATWDDSSQFDGMVDRNNRAARVFWHEFGHSLDIIIVSDEYEKIFNDFPENFSDQDEDFAHWFSTYMMDMEHKKSHPEFWGDDFERNPIGIEFRKMMEGYGL